MDSPSSSFLLGKNIKSIQYTRNKFYKKKKEENFRISNEFRIILWYNKHYCLQDDSFIMIQ